MSEAAFARSQRVIVPANLAGAEGVQGVITAVKTFIGREPEYDLQWPVADMIGANGFLVIVQSPTPESELLAAQPGKTVTADEAQHMINRAVIDAQVQTRDQVEREFMTAARQNARRKRRR